MTRRIAAVLVAIMFVVTLLTGCGKDEKPQISDPMQDQEQTAQTRYAYQATYGELDLEQNVVYINQFMSSGDNLYLVGDVITGKEVYQDPVTMEPILDENGQQIEFDVTQQRIFSLDSATGKATMLDYSVPALEAGVEGSSYINCFYPGQNGSLYFLETTYSYSFNLPEDFNPETEDPYAYYVDNGSQMTVVQVDASGAELQRIPLTIPADTYISETVVLPDGTIYATDWASIYRFDSNGQVAGQLPMEQGVSRMIPIGNSQLGVTIWEENGYVLKSVDGQTMSLGESRQLPHNCYSIQPGVDEYEYIYENNTIFYGLKPGSTEPEKLFSWMDCDVDSGNIGQNYVLTSDGTIYAIESVYEESTQRNSFQLITMKQVDASTLPQKQILTLACMYLDWDLRTDIIAFNRSRDDVRIVVQDYSQYATEEDYNAGLQKLNTEILSGVVPDLFYLDGTIPADVYAARGVLMDLWPLIDSDPELSREDLMTHFFDQLSVDGKLYQAVATFNIETAVGLRSVIGERSTWTVQELMEIYRDLPTDASIFGEMDTRENILNSCILRSSNEFIDWENQSCSFNSQEFVDLLEFVNAFPETFDYDNYDWELYENETVRMRQGKQLLIHAHLSGFEQLQNYIYTCDQQPCFVGYPTTTGNGSNFQVYGGLAISSACRNTDAAWDFVRRLLTEEYQIQDYMWSFPTNRHAFETYATRQMTPDYQTDESGQFVLDENGEKIELPKSMYWISDEEYGDIFAMTQQEYDLMMTIYENTAGVMSASEAINEIIQSEAEAFFAGQKSAKETAELIQNRASMYVFEQG